MSTFSLPDIKTVGFKDFSLAARALYGAYLQRLKDAIKDRPLSERVMVTLLTFFSPDDGDAELLVGKLSLLHLTLSAFFADVHEACSELYALSRGSVSAGRPSRSLCCRVSAGPTLKN
jgi:hypothetical protein